MVRRQLRCESDPHYQRDREHDYDNHQSSRFPSSSLGNENGLRYMTLPHLHQKVVLLPALQQDEASAQAISFAHHTLLIHLHLVHADAALLQGTLRLTLAGQEAVF